MVLLKRLKLIELLVVLFLLGLAVFSCDSGPNDDNKNPLKIKIGQMIMVGFRGLELTSSNPIRDDIIDLHIGGVVLYDRDIPDGLSYRNIESPEQLRNLISSIQNIAETPLFVAIDQEGGWVNRLKVQYGFPLTVTQQYLGELNDPDSTRFYANRTAATLKDLGINLNLAPVVDLNINPNSPAIGHYERSFSADPDIVISNALIVIEEHHGQNIYTTLKHYPGHGSSTTDSHLGFTDVTDTWQHIELEPFAAIIDSGKCDVIMAAHIFNQNLDPIYPATLSENTVTDILRDSLDWGGLIISDDMQMSAISDNYGLETAIELAINAGVDILLFSNNSTTFDPEIAHKAIEIIYQLVQDGKISEERIDESNQRIQALKQFLN